MTVPANCTTVHVSNVSGNALCDADADYVLDAAIGHWVNENNPSCRIAKFRDPDGSITGNAGDWYWAWLILTPPGTTAPPGATSVYMGNFPCYLGAGGSECWRTTINGPTATSFTTGNGVGLQLLHNGILENNTDITWTSSTNCSQNNLTLTTGTLSLSDGHFNNHDLAVEVDYDLTASDFKWYYSYNGASRVWSADGWNANNLMIDIGNNRSYFVQLPDLYWTNLGGNGLGVPNGWGAGSLDPRVTVVVNSLTPPALDFTPWADLTGFEACFASGW